MTYVIDAHLTVSTQNEDDFPGQFFLASDRATGVLHVGYDDKEDSGVSEKFAAFFADPSPMKEPVMISAAASTKRSVTVAVEMLAFVNYILSFLVSSLWPSTEPLVCCTVCATTRKMAVSAKSLQHLLLILRQ